MIVSLIVAVISLVANWMIFKKWVGKDGRGLFPFITTISYVKNCMEMVGSSCVC